LLTHVSVLLIDWHYRLLEITVYKTATEICTKHNTKICKTAVYILNKI